ncbi:MAG: glycogen synthase GlgA [Nitrospirae bacterium]|nr:glycogen synthase GlgA [Nitrospirota bacterium]
MRILIASPEAVPFAKTGGLADVAGALADEYRKKGIHAAVILPFYSSIRKKAAGSGIKPLNIKIDVPLGSDTESGLLWKGKTPGGADAYFIENRKFYDRDELYGTSSGDYPDNASRFIFYSRGVLEALKALGMRPDVIHCNDWQSALIPVYLKRACKNDFPSTSTLLTIHNLGYQGIFSSDNMPLTGLGWETFTIDGLEFYGNINFLKGGILYSDVITTVSMTYSEEILTKEHGFGLDGVLQTRRNDISGIVNGVDIGEWAPSRDPFIAARFNKKDLSGKAACKKSLQKELGLNDDDRPLIGLVARLSAQKGLDIVAESVEGITGSGAKLAVLGKGDNYFGNLFSQYSLKYRGLFSFRPGFDNTLAHKVYAGSDIFLMPSVYEPCGLGQLIAMRYGAVPVVKKTGGLADTVAEYDIPTGKGTGFLFRGHSSAELVNALEKAYNLYYDKRLWNRLILNAMSGDFSWRRPAEKYVSLYKKLIRKTQYHV